VSLKGREFEINDCQRREYLRGTGGMPPPGNFETLYFGNAIFSILRANQSGLIAVNLSQFFCIEKNNYADNVATGEPENQSTRCCERVR